MAIQRIATVLATGDRYIVQRMSIGRTPADTRVHVWGEVVECKSGLRNTHAERLASGASTKHAASKTFTATAVSIAEVDVTMAYADELLAQGMRNLPNVRGMQTRTVRSRRSR